MALRRQPLCFPPPRCASSLPRTGRRSGEQGAILLEVVLALVLFVVAAAIIGGGISASVDSVERLRLNTQAASLAATVGAELELGIRALEASGPAEFEPPFVDWTWEVIPTTTTTTIADETTSPTFTMVEIVVRHQDPPIVHRLTRSIHLGEIATGDSWDLDSLDTF